MTRAEHLAWCKRRANEYLIRGDVTNACASFYSDMNKHPETEGHIAIPLMFQMQLGGMLNTVTEAKRFIDGFN